MLVIAPQVGRPQPLHPGAEVTIAEGPERQVEVIGQEARGQDPHRSPPARLGDQADEGAIILVLVTDGGAAIASIEEVVAVATGRGACGPWHEVFVQAGDSVFKKKTRVAKFS